MKYLVFLILLIIVSCTQPSPIEFTYFKISNNTDHNIDIKLINNDFQDSLLSLSGMNSRIDTFVDKYFLNPPPFLADSVTVVYDDTISIMHFPTLGQDIRKNIYYEES